MPQVELNEQSIREMVKALKHKALTYRSSGNQKMFAAARRAARQLEKWWEAGASGACPVDFERFELGDYVALCAGKRVKEHSGIEEKSSGPVAMQEVERGGMEADDEERTLLDAPEETGDDGADVTVVQEDSALRDEEEATLVTPPEEDTEVENSLFPGGASASPDENNDEEHYVVVEAAPPLESAQSLEPQKEEEIASERAADAETMQPGNGGIPAFSAKEAEEALPPSKTPAQEQTGDNGKQTGHDVPGFSPVQSVGAMEREHLVEAEPPMPQEPKEMEAQQRASRLRDIRDALRDGKYEEALRLAKVELTITGLEPDERAALETLRDEAQAGLIDRWMTRANEAYQAKQWDEALKWARKVLSLDEKHEGAQRLRQEAEPELERQSALQRAEMVRQQVEQMLTRLEKGVGVDIRAMETLVREGESLRDAWAAEGLLETEKGQTFQQALQQLRERFDEKRKQHGQRTTADAVKSYEAIRDAIPEMEAALRRGEEAWWDDRSGSFRPIVELLDEFRARLPELAREVALRHSKKAQAALKVHRPQEASDEVEQALALDALPNDVRADLEGLQVEAQAELAQWQKAANLLEEARGLQDPVERWKKILQAEEAYPYHENLGEAKEHAHEDLLAWAQQYIDDALVSARSLLQDEKFKQARRTVGEIRRTLTSSRLPEEEIAQIWQKVETFEQDIQEIEERREAINAQARRIRALLGEGEISQAYQIYKEALQSHPDWEDDRVFGPLGRELRAKLGDREKIQEGWRLFELGHWEEAQEAVKDISSEELQEDIRRLKTAVAVAKTLADIQERWERGYYRDVEKRIDGLLSARGESIAAEDRERLQQYKAEVEERRKGDREAWLQLGKVGLRSADTITDAKAFAAVLEEFPEGVEGLEAALQMYQAIQGALAKPSTLDGYLRDAEEKLGAWIRKRTREVVERLVEEHAWEEAKKWLDVLRKHWPHLDRRWREGQYRAYFEHRAQALEKERAWDELIDMWLEAQSVLPGAFEFVQREKEARREQLLAFARQRLMTAQPGVPEEVIEKLESDREVWDDAARAVYQLAHRLHDLDGLLQRGQLEGVRAFAEEISKEWGETEAGQRVLSKSSVQDILDRRFTIAAQALLKQGDEARDDNPGEALIAYARGLQLPLPPAEENILRRRLEAFGHLGERYVKELAQTLARAEVAPNVPLQQQYEEIKRQRQQAWALLGVLPYLVSSASDVSQWEKGLREGVRRAESKAKALEMALDVLQRYAEDGATWAEVLRTGRWEHVRQDIEEVQSALGVSHSEIAALQDRLERMKEYRGKLESLRHKVDEAYRNDRFDEGLRSIKMIQDYLAKLDTTPAGEPFGVIQNMRLFDVETNEMVRGLEQIQTLLEQRLRNLQAWQGWSDFLQQKEKRLHPDVENLQEWEDDLPTEREVTYIEETLAKCEGAIDKAAADRPADEPLSEAAQKVKEEGESALRQLEEWRQWLRNRYEERWVDMAALVKKAQELVDMGNFAEAETVISSGLHYQPEHEFLRYLGEVTAQWQEEEVGRSSSWLGRLWPRR